MAAPQRRSPKRLACSRWAEEDQDEEPDIALTNLAVIVKLDRPAHLTSLTAFSEQPLSHGWSVCEALSDAGDVHWRYEREQKNDVGMQQSESIKIPPEESEKRH